MVGPWEKYKEEVGPWERYKKDGAEDVSVEMPGQEEGGGFVSEMIGNIPESATNVARDVYHAVTSPVETLKSVGRAGAGFMEATSPHSEPSPSSMPEDKQSYEALKSAISDRYGSIDNAAETLKNDPVGFVVDLSSVFTGAGGLLSKAPGLAGKAGEISRTAGLVTDPISGTLMASKRAAGLVTPNAVKEMVIAKFSPEGLYGSAMKFSNNPDVLTPVERRTAINTGLSEKMLPNESSYQRLWDKVQRNKAKVTNIIDEGSRQGKSVSTENVLKLFTPLEKRAKLVDKVRPEFAEVLREARANIESFGENIPARNAQAIKETLQDLSKYGVDDRSRFVAATNKAAARGLRLELERQFPSLKNLNKNSAALLTLENQLAKAVGRVGNRDIVGLGMKVALGGAADVSKAGNVLSSILDLPNVKARLAIAIFEGKTGKKVPLKNWRTAAKIIAGHETRLAAAQSGRTYGQEIE